MKDHSLSGTIIHTYSSIEKRNDALQEYPRDFHILKMEDIGGDTDIVAHLGTNFLFSAQHSPQFGRIRVDWNVRDMLSREDVAKMMLKHYGEWICSVAQGDLQVEVDIQKGYKTRGSILRIPACDSESYFRSISQHPAFETFQGLILGGYKTEGRSACIGLDTVYFDNPWNAQKGMIFVELDHDIKIGDKLASLYSDTARPLDKSITFDLPKMLEFNTL